MVKSENKKNTFKFQNFEELIRVDILLNRNKKLDPKEESHLFECFKKWSTLNRSLEFDELRHAIGPKILTLNLLLINEEEVVNILFDYIDKCTALSATTVLDMLQSLVCDIRKDFLPYLERSITLITKLIERSAGDSEVILSAFNCLAHIIVFLERHLIKNIDILLPLIKPLLFHSQKYYIRHFTAQSLAFIVRRAADFKKMFSHDILTTLVNGDHSQHCSDAIGKLMSSCLTNKQILTQTAPQMLATYFQILTEQADSSVEFFINCMDCMLQDLLSKLDIDGYKTIWSAIVDCIGKCDQTVPDELALLVLEFFFKYANGRSLSRCSADVIALVKNHLNTKYVDNKMIEIVRLLIDKLGQSPDIANLVQSLLQTDNLAMSEKFAFAEKFINNEALELVVKTGINSHISSLLAANRDIPNDLLTHMTSLVMKKYPANRQHSWAHLTALQGINYNLFLVDDGARLVQHLLDIITISEQEELIWMVCIIVPHFHQANTDKRFVAPLILLLQRYSIDANTANRLHMIDALLDCLTNLIKINGQSDLIQSINIHTSVQPFLTMLDQRTSIDPNEPVLLAIITKLISLDLSKNKLLSPNQFIERLRSPNHRSRHNSIQILLAITAVSQPGSVTHALTTCDEIETLLELPETELVTRERTLTRILDAMTFQMALEVPQQGRAIIINHLVGMMHVQVSTLWSRLQRTIASYCVVADKSHGDETIAANEDIIWDAIKQQIDATRHLSVAMDIAEDEEGLQLSCNLHRQYTIDRYNSTRPPNWHQFRINLIKLLSQLSELAARKTATLSPILLGLFESEFGTAASNEVAGNVKQRNDTLIALMQLYSKFPNVAGIHSEQKLKRIYTRCLSRPKLAHTAMSCLLQYRQPELLQYRSELESIVRPAAKSDKKQSDSNPIDALRQLPFSSIADCHRTVVVPVLIRLVLGRLKDSTYKQHQKTIINYLADLSNPDEIRLLLAILLEPLKRNNNVDTLVDSTEPIEQISGTLRQSVQEQREAMPIFVRQSIAKRLVPICNHLHSLLAAMLNKIEPDTLVAIMLTVLDAYAIASILRDLPSDHPISHLRPLRQQCSNTIIFYFNKLGGEIGTGAHTSLLHQNILDTVVQPQLVSLVEDNLSSANTTIRLALLWSQTHELVPLISDEMVDKFVELLTKSKLNRQLVAFPLVQIMYNLVQHASKGRPHSNRLRPVIGRNVSAMVDYLGSRVRQIKMHKLNRMKPTTDMTIINEATITRMELLMISLLANEYILSKDKSVEAMVNSNKVFAMIDSMLFFLNKTNPIVTIHTSNTHYNHKTEDDMAKDDAKEQLEVDFLKAMNSMMAIVDTNKILDCIERFLSLFYRLKRRSSRTVLASCLSSLWLRIASHLPSLPQRFPDLAQIGYNLNAWHQTQLQEMDSDLIVSTLQQLMVLLQEVPINQCVDQPNEVLQPKLWLYLLTCQNCLFFLTEVAELGVRQMSQDFLEKIIESIAAAIELKCVENMFYDHLWPAIKCGLAIKNESFRFSFISLAKSTVLQLGKTERFRDMSILATEQNGFFDNMLSLTTAFNSRGLRTLVRFLNHQSVSELNLKDILLPLVMHRIEVISDQYNSANNISKSELTHAQRESLDSSFEALSAVARQLSLGAYQHLVQMHMSRLDAGRNVELVIKTLIGLLNGYNGRQIDDKSQSEPSFMMDVLHRLERHLARRVTGTKHKHAQKSASAPEDLMDQKNAEWTLRGMALQVPVALAIVNIAVQLPQKFLKQIVTKVVLRICDFLKAKEVDIRKEAGTTLLKIVEIINRSQTAITSIENGRPPIQFLSFIFNTVRGQLNRGFQCHVALSTCHRLLQGLHDKKIFDKFSIDFSSIRVITELYLDELFGEMAREKLERSTAEKGIVPEAKNVKAFEGLRLLANLIDRDHLFEFFKLLVSAATAIGANQSGLQKMQRIFESLQCKGGLVRNDRLDAVTGFTLAMMLISNHVDSLLAAEKPSTGSRCRPGTTDMADMHLYRPATRLDGLDTPNPPANAARSAAHLITNCGLSLMHALAKMHRSNAQVNLAAMVDPVLPLVISILNTVQHRIILLSAIKCLHQIIPINPPSLATHVNDISILLFKIFNRFGTGSSGTASHDDGISTAFNKTMSQFLQRSDVRLDRDQFQIIILGAHIDSLNDKHQSTSFQLLRALMDNRIRTPVLDTNVIHLTGFDELDQQLGPIIDQVIKLALVASSEKARTDARLTFTTFLRNFRQSGEYLRDKLQMLYKQMANNEDSSLSACLMIQTIITEYKPAEFDVDAMAPFQVAFAVMAMQLGVTSKVEAAILMLVARMTALSTEPLQLADMVVNYLSKYGSTDKKYRIALMLVQAQWPHIPIDSRLQVCDKIVTKLIEDLPNLVALSDKLDGQLSASSGQDADLIDYLAKKPRHEHDTNEEDSTVTIETRQELSSKLTVIMENINAVLRFMSHMLVVDQQNEIDVACMSKLLIQCCLQSTWSLIVTKLMRCNHTIVRFNASKLVINPMLTLSHQYDNELFSTFATSELINSIIGALFAQLKCNDLTQEEIDTIVVNLLLVWQITIADFPANKSDRCKRMLNGANNVAKEELLAKKTLYKRCAMLKFLAGLCIKTSLEDLQSMDLEKSILYMYLREERQASDENSDKRLNNKKRSQKAMEQGYCSQNAVLEWKALVAQTDEIIRTGLGEEKYKRLTLDINKERKANKLKKINEESALAVSNQGEFLAKKRKKSTK